MQALLKRFCPKRIKKFVRFMRKVYFIFFDFLGNAIFCLLRLFGLLPKISDFEKNSIKKILIIRLDRIGDVILSTPAIRAIRQGFPEAEIKLLVREYTKDLVIHNPNIDRLLIYEKDKIGNDYDLAIVLHPGFKQNYITFISGARYRIGYIGWGGGFFLTHKLIDDRKIRIRHEVESALEVAGSIGCSTNNKNLEISVTEEGERFAEFFFQEHQFKADDTVVAMGPGARQEYIRWKKEGFAAVADTLIKQNKAKVIMVGGREGKGLIENVLSLMQQKPILAIGLRLTELISLIKRCDLFIGNSTGPMHIAAALRVPVVAIFGNIHPLDSYQAWGPWGEGHIVVSKNLNCPDCHPSDCKTFDCLELLTADEVLEAAKKQIKKYVSR